MRNSISEILVCNYFYVDYVVYHFKFYFHYTTYLCKDAIQVYTDFTKKSPDFHLSSPHPNPVSVAV